MKYYEELLDKKCFSFKDVEQLVGGNHNTAKSLLRQYVQKGYIQQIKKNLYVAVSIESGMPIATRYQIASSITQTSYVSHRSAFEFYGYTNQVSYEMNVSSDTFFGDFEYEGIAYACISSRLSEGIVSQQGVRVSDLERTTIDYIGDFDRIGGLEELLQNLEMIPFLSEKKLLRYLELSDKAVLYQKTGYILEHFRDSLKLSDDFFHICCLRKGKSKRYFTKSADQNRMIYNSKWGLMVPENLLSISE
ncbi:MAG: transcriptional regulator [Roseburia sp.]|nr:transcriptional regulator [Roseburia sp.]